MLSSPKRRLFTGQGEVQPGERAVQFARGGVVGVSGVDLGGEDAEVPMAYFSSPVSLRVQVHPLVDRRTSYLVTILAVLLVLGFSEVRSPVVKTVTADVVNLLGTVSAGNLAVHKLPSTNTTAHRVAAVVDVPVEPREIVEEIRVDKSEASLCQRDPLRSSDWRRLGPLTRRSVPTRCTTRPPVFAFPGVECKSAPADFTRLGVRSHRSVSSSELSQAPAVSSGAGCFNTRSLA